MRPNVKVNAINAVTTQPSTAPDALGILSHLPEPVAVVDREMRIIYANHAALPVFKTGKTLSEIAGATHPLLQSLARTMRDMTGITLHNVEIAGQTLESVTLTSLKDEILVTARRANTTIGFVQTGQTRNVLEPARHMARTLAHEIKNPLAGIQGAAQLLKRTAATDKDVELLSLIINETGRIMRLVEKVDIFGEGNTQNFDDVNLHQALGQVVATMTASVPDVKIKTAYDPSLPAIKGDMDQLVQMFLNIAKNAVEAGATSVLLRSYYDTAAPYHPDMHMKLPLTIEIEDNGNGIDGDKLAMVFTPYYSTKPEGAGIGLAIVSKIAEAHHALIGVQSKPGKTTFKFSFSSKMEGPAA